MQLVASLPIGPPGATPDDHPTLASVVAAQRVMSDRSKHKIRRQGKIE